MRYEEMSRTQKNRINFDTCLICKRKFTKLDDIQELKMKYGRAMLHFYFHSNCLIGIRCPSQLANREEAHNEQIKEA